MTKTTRKLKIWVIDLFAQKRETRLIDYPFPKLPKLQDQFNKDYESDKTKKWWHITDFSYVLVDENDQEIENN